jgi:hypothetical protein
VILAEGLSKDELRAYALVDNRLGDTSSFDIEVLKAELEDLTLNLDFDMSDVGFSDKEIEALLKADEFKPDLPDDDKEPSIMTHKLTIECEDAAQKQDLFDELKERGFKVKGG